MPSAENTAAVERREDQGRALPQSPGQARTAKAVAAAAIRRKELKSDIDHITKRFLAKVDKNGPIPARRPELGPCWLWTNYKLPRGYGMFGVGGRNQLAHRVSHELFVGPIADGLEVDHLCVNPPCVNPDHLEAVTPRENTLRSGGPSAKNALKTHCLYGHPFDEENTRRYNNGRWCRECHRQSQREYRRKQREQKAEVES